MLNNQRFCWRYGSLLLICLLITGIAGVCLPPPLLAADEEQAEARVAVTLRAEPGIQVARGAILTYKLRVKNDGDVDVADVLIYMPYDPGTITLIGTEFAQPADWVTAIAPDHLMIKFGQLKVEQQRTAQLQMRVAASLPDNTVINMWAGYSWSGDVGASAAKSSNAAPVLVGPTNETSSWVWMTVTPTQGPGGTTYTFFSDRFLPGEQIFTWLNSSDGAIGTDFSTEADENGRVQFDYANAALTPGSYQMVLLGKRSELTAVTNFVVTP